MGARSLAGQRAERFGPTPMTAQDLIKRANLSDIADLRDQALEHWRQAAAHIAAGNKLAEQACITDAAASFGFSLGSEVARCLAYRKPDDGAFLEATTKRLDAAIWRHVLRATALADVLDAKARKELEEMLDKDCPPATFENMAGTLQTLVGQSPQLIERGVVELFRALSRNHRTNNRFTVGPKFILGRAFSQVTATDTWQTWNHWGSGRDHLVDLERTLHVLDGRRPPEHSGTIVARIDSERISQHRGTARAREYDTDLIRLVWFQNGNAHGWIKRPDLLAKVNRIIAKHFGEVLPEGHRA